MDIPRPRPKATWRDAPWWQATEQSLVSCLLMTGLATPFIIYFATQLMRLSHQQLDTRMLFSELAKGSLAMLPYLWAYFFALERIAQQRNKDYPQYLEQGH